MKERIFITCFEKFYDTSFIIKYLDYFFKHNDKDNFKVLCCEDNKPVRIIKTWCELNGVEHVFEKSGSKFPREMVDKNLMNYATCMLCFWDGIEDYTYDLIKKSRDLKLPLYLPNICTKTIPYRLIQKPKK